MRRSSHGPRLLKGFERLLAETVEWPQPKQLAALLPRRPHRQALPLPRPSEEEYEAGREQARKLTETFT